MRHHQNIYRSFFCVFTTVALIIISQMGCGPNNNSALSQNTLSTADSAIVLTVVKGTQTLTFTMTQLKALPMTTGWGGWKSNTGAINGPYQFKGVAISEILKSVGGISGNSTVKLTAKDGFLVVLSYDQITKGTDFLTTDINGKAASAENNVVVLLAYERDGKPLDDTVGPLQMGIMTSKNLVTDGRWWVKWVQKIEVISK